MNKWNLPEEVVLGSELQISSQRSDVIWMGHQAQLAMSKQFLLLLMNTGRENGLITEMKFTFNNLDIGLFFSNHGDTDNPGKEGKDRQISLSSRQAWSTEWAAEQPGLYSESLFRKIKINKQINK